MTAGARPDQFNAIANGIVQYGIDCFTVSNRGFQLDDKTFDRNPARYYLLPEDLQELTADMNSAIHREVLKLTAKTSLEHPCIYRVLPTGDLLIGISKEDLNERSEVTDFFKDEGDV